jgi:Flp pilus assembly pilin Flp
MTLATPARPTPPIASPAAGPTASRARLRSILRRVNDDEGAATAEYAITTMAAVAFAGLLVAIMRSDEVRGILTDLVRRALSFEG